MSSQRPSIHSFRSLLSLSPHTRFFDLEGRKKGIFVGENLVKIGEMDGWTVDGWLIYSWVSVLTATDLKDTDDVQRDVTLHTPTRSSRADATLSPIGLNLDLTRKGGTNVRRKKQEALKQKGSGMLRRRRSLAALLSSSSASSASASAEAEEDVPPLPLGLTRATPRAVNGVKSGVSGGAKSSAPHTNGAETNANGPKSNTLKKSGSINRGAPALSSVKSAPLSNGKGKEKEGLIQRVSALFRVSSTSSSPAKSSKRGGFKPTPRYKAGVASTPDVRRANAKQLASSSTADEEEEDDIRRPSGLGRAASLSRSRSPSSRIRPHPHAHALVEGSEVGSEDDGNSDAEDDIRQPAGLGKPASLRSLPLLRDADVEAEEARAYMRPWERVPSLSASSASHPSPPMSTANTSTPRARTRSTPLPFFPRGGSPPLPALPKVQLPAALWARVLRHVALPDAASAAQVCRGVCGAARGRMYGAVDLRAPPPSLAHASSSSLAYGGGPFGGRGRELGREGRVGTREGTREREGSGGDRGGAEGGQSLARSLREAHLAGHVRAVVCAGWPPWGGEGEEEAHLHSSSLAHPASWTAASTASRSILPPLLSTSRVLFLAPTLRTSSAPTRYRPFPILSSLSPPFYFTSMHFPALRTLTIFPAPTGPLDTRALLAFLRAHPTLERLAVLGADAHDDDADDDADQEADDNAPFLPRLTHLHAPPALAARVLPRLSAPPPAPAAPPPAAKGLSAEALALLAPDPKRLGWHRVRSQNAEVEALAGAFLEAEAAAATAQGSVRRIPRKPVPALPDDGAGEEGAQVVKADVVRAARAVYVQSPARAGGGAALHPLRVLRIAVARPMYEGGAGAGGGRVGRAVGGLLAARNPTEGDEGLALHVLFGPRVERRTIEKVLRTLGAGVGEAFAAAPASPVRGRKQPSAWRMDGDAAAVESEPGASTRGLALLEVRSAVRAAELYKIMHGVLPRYPALHTLLLTRPPTRYPPRPASPPTPSEPPSPRSPSFFFPSPPSTPGFPPPPPLPHARDGPPPSPSLLVPPSPSPRVPPSPSSRAPPPPSSPSLRVPSSPSALAPPSPAPSARSLQPYAPSLASTLAPPPGLPPAEDACAWEWDGWGTAAAALSPLQGLEDIDADMDGLSEEDAGHVAAWRRHCAGLGRRGLLDGAQTDIRVFRNVPAIFTDTSVWFPALADARLPPPARLGFRHRCSIIADARASRLVVLSLQKSGGAGAGRRTKVHIRAEAPAHHLAEGTCASFSASSD
ncbi:hypothetical protein FB451DRAFT_1476552 [Mycena latifolia]|nr:hypothetical protein FB451DRAFT_1476552 [Mycena latifolia]